MVLNVKDVITMKIFVIKVVPKIHLWILKLIIVWKLKLNWKISELLF